MNGTEKRTTVLGDFDDLERELVLQILREHGIYSFAARPEGDAVHAPYPFPWMTTAGTILVDAERVAEARALIERELPAHLASIREAMARLDDDGNAD